MILDWYANHLREKVTRVPRTVLMRPEGEMFISYRETGAPGHYCLWNLMENLFLYLETVEFFCRFSFIFLISFFAQDWEVWEKLMVRNAHSRQPGISAWVQERFCLICAVSLRCKKWRGALHNQRKLWMQGYSWETAHCLGHLAREMVIKQINPIDNPLSCEQSHVGKISGGNITYAWPVLSAPSRSTYNYYRKEKISAADCSESMKVLLCSPAECEHKILTVTAVCYFLCCWGTTASLSGDISF